MRPRWLSLSEHEQNAFRAIVAYLENRLEDRETINWALSLKDDDIVKKYAVLEIVERRAGQKLTEPWRSAWRLIEEYWKVPPKLDRPSMEAYQIQQRLSSGERSGFLVSEIVEIVKPRLKLRALTGNSLLNKRLKRKPKTVEDLLSTSLSSGDLLHASDVNLDTISSDKDFLCSLAFSLDAAVMGGLDLARRINWDETKFYWKIGTLNRVYYVDETDDGEDDPDKFSKGIAPSVKLLYQVVKMLADLDSKIGVEFAARWESISSPVHLRLRAALMRDPRLATGEEVSKFCLSIQSKYFWDTHSFPEISELRATRFNDFSPKAQDKIISKICKLPPRKLWAKDSEEDRVAQARLFSAVREMRRIELSVGDLSSIARQWLNSFLPQFPELAQLTRNDVGFPFTIRTERFSPNKDDSYDLFNGRHRLKALEVALASGRDWNDNPAGLAVNWIQGNALEILEDLESVNDGGAEFPNVWERFGWAFSPTAQKNADDKHPKDVAQRLFLIINLLPAETIENAIDGISHLVLSWAKFASDIPEALKIWLKVWPLAVDATNKNAAKDREEPFDEVFESRKPKELDTLNPPAGKLVGAFLLSCPAVCSGVEVFQNGTPLKIMRDAIEETIGASGSIVKARLVEHMPYFLAADSEWTKKTLVPPLLADDTESLILWASVARQKLSFEVMEILGPSMADRATDPRLKRDTRKSLVFKIVIDCLYAYKDARDPFVSHDQIEQMLRSLDEEVRAYGANAVQRFVRDLSKPKGGTSSDYSPEELFRNSAKPFVCDVWPKEKSLRSPGVSKAFADLPTAAGEEFADAVSVISPFLVPFECWSMSDFGLYGSENDELKTINTPEKVKAFLQLLDGAIGNSERAVVPYDLADALAQIRGVAPSLATDRAFRRLAATARR